MVLRRALHHYLRHVPRHPYTTSLPRGGPFGIVLDIDGVLVRGSEPIPGANIALSALSASHTRSNPKDRLPFIFMTNGGGMTENAKAKQISKDFFPQLPVPIVDSQVLLSHTPFKELVPKYKDKLVMVLGAKDTVKAAKNYGFQKVTTVDEYLHCHPDLFPFHTYKQRTPKYNEPIHAIMIYHDPLDWAVEIQGFAVGVGIGGMVVVLCDVIQGGVLHTDPTKVASNQIPVYASNPDLVFSSRYPAPRLAQGAFVEAWQSVYTTCYGGPKLQITRYGKPTPTAYRYAERMLIQEALRLGAITSEEVEGQGRPFPFPLQTIYAIGDNPAADIQGANNANGQMTRWVSILVQTGVFPPDRPNDPQYPAHHVVQDIRQAFQLIAQLEGASHLATC